MQRQDEMAAYKHTSMSHVLCTFQSCPEPDVYNSRYLSRRALREARLMRQCFLVELQGIDPVCRRPSQARFCL